MLPGNMLFPLFASSLIFSIRIGIASSINNTAITFGFPRYPERDTADWLVGMYVAISEANADAVVPGYDFKLHLGHIPACASSVWSDCMAQAEAAAVPFFGNISTMTAILTPDWWIVEGIVAATASARMPIISPKTFGHLSTEHVVFLNQPVESDIPHNVAFMLGAHRCARTGIVVTNYMITLGPVYAMKKAFLYGGYPEPPFIFTNVTVAEMKRFILEEDPDRLCFLLLITLEELQWIFKAIKGDARFSTAKYTFFAFNNLETGVYAVEGDSTPFDSFYITRHIPTMLSNTSITNKFLAAFDKWLVSADYAGDAATFLPGEAVPSEPSESALFTYLATHYVIEAVRIAAKARQRTASGVLPAPTPSDVLDVMYTNRIRLGGLVYQPLVNACPDPPAEQLCFCNVATRTTFTFKVNGTTGRLHQIYDDVEKGEKNVALTILAADECSNKLVEIGNYPIAIGALMYDGAAFDYFHDQVTHVMGTFVAAINYMDPPPARPFRSIETRVAYGSIDDARLQTFYNQAQPFMVGVSLGPVTTSSSLILFPHADNQDLEDPPLRRHQRHDENLLQTMGSVADYIHALVGYYTENSAQFTSLHAFASTHAEATLIVKSLNTFQIDMTAIVEPDATKWADTLTSLLDASTNPFVLVSTHNNQPLVSTVFGLRKTGSKGTVGIALPDGSVMSEGWNAIVGDMVFATALPSWWNAQTVVGRYLSMVGFDAELGADPSMSLIAMCFGLAHTIAQQAIAASNTAAALLYQMGSVSVAEVTFGPYSNATCTDKQIEENERDRTCQCYKGPRVFHVHNLLDIKENQPGSLRTKGYRLALNTCGVKYYPFIHPASSISDGAIAGIAAAAGGVVIATVLTMLICIRCFYGKKHWHAPHDANVPFAMVFTDIQNSTGLWARAPAAMSTSVEQHHSIIRSLIKKYKGYEVKTIGDSFMIAFKNVSNATRLALEIQSAFFDAKWPQEIDANYMELIAEAMCNDAKMGAMLGTCEEQYLKIWGGLRVRVGVHYGMGDIRKDPVSEGYDYYGTIVNTAARVEGVGHGGQVLLTEDAFQALEPDFVTANAMQVIDLGPQPLRGLDQPVQLRQVTLPRFQERRFPPLRLDVEHVIVDEADHSEVSGSEATGELVPPDVMAQRVIMAQHGSNKIDIDTLIAYYNFFNAGFSATSDTWRRGAVKELCRVWNVEAHSSNKNALMKTLMQLVVKMERAARGKKANSARASLNGTGSTKGTVNRSYLTVNATPTPTGGGGGGNGGGGGGEESGTADFVRQSSEQVFAFSVPGSPAVVIPASSPLGPLGMVSESAFEASTRNEANDAAK